MIFIPLGQSCDAAIHLSRSGLRKHSLPFDWVASFDYSSVIYLATHILETKGKGFFRHMRYYRSDNNEIDDKLNKILKAADPNISSRWTVSPDWSGVVLVHHDPIAHRAAKDACKRRIYRFINLVESKEKLFFIQSLKFNQFKGMDKQSIKEDINRYRNALDKFQTFIKSDKYKIIIVVLGEFESKYVDNQIALLKSDHIDVHFFKNIPLEAGDSMAFCDEWDAVFREYMPELVDESKVEILDT